MNSLIDLCRQLFLSQQVSQSKYGWLSLNGHKQSSINDLDDSYQAPISRFWVCLKFSWRLLSLNITNRLTLRRTMRVFAYRLNLVRHSQMATKHFEYITNKIATAKRNADSLCANIGHRGMEGEIRELAMRECIEPFLTQSYSCGTGKVIDTYQAISDQIDLVVYHRKVAPPILISRDLGLFPVECVRYVFEIKSTLTATELKDANKKFRSIRNLKSFPRIDSKGNLTHGALPSTVLFAFSSDIAGSEIERYMKHTEDDRPPCTVLCVLGKGYWFYDGATQKWHGADTADATIQNVEFTLFITGFMNTLAAEETSMRPFNPGTYVKAEEELFKAVDAPVA